MPTKRRNGRIAVLVAALALAGCGDEAEEISNLDYLLPRQHALWEKARRTLASEQPNLNLLRSLEMYLAVRTPRRLDREYDGANKEQVLAKLAELTRAYQAEVLSKLVLQNPQVTAKAGVTIEQIRAAFEGLEADYQAFKAMLPSG